MSNNPSSSSSKPVNDLIRFWGGNNANSADFTHKRNDVISSSSVDTTSLPPTPPSSLSIIEIQTLSKKNDIGRIDWSSIPQPRLETIDGNAKSNSISIQEIIKKPSPAAISLSKSIIHNSHVIIPSHSSSNNTTIPPPTSPSKEDITFIGIKRDNVNNDEIIPEEPPPRRTLPPIRRVTNLITKFEKNRSNSSGSSKNLASPSSPTSPFYQRKHDNERSDNNNPPPLPSDTGDNNNNHPIQNPSSILSDFHETIENQKLKGRSNIYKVIGSKYIGGSSSKKPHVLASAQETNNYMMGKINEKNSDFPHNESILDNYDNLTMTNENKKEQLITDSNFATSIRNNRNSITIINESDSISKINNITKSKSESKKRQISTTRNLQESRYPRRQSTSSKKTHHHDHSNKIERKKTVLGPRPYSLRRPAPSTSTFPTPITLPQRSQLSPTNTLKRHKELIRATSIKSQTHDLPEYTSSKTKLSLMVPHNIANSDYGKLNHSVPDLTARNRDSNFNRNYRKNNQTVPDLTRIEVFLKSEKDNVNDNYNYKNNTLEFDLTKVTKFSFNAYDESDEINELFKPGAPWIHLPQLDEFIKSLPKTEFTSPKDIMTDEEYQKFIGQLKFYKTDIFPPMNQIPDDLSLDDLKNNNKQSNQRMQNDIVSAGIDGVLGAQGSLYGINMMKLEIFRDFIQLLTLTLSFVTSNLFGTWLQTLLDTLPNLFSLNFQNVFGNGFAFLLAFFLICFAALYWFRKMTKHDPNEVVEGLESYPWNLRPERSKKENIVVVFVITSLYLPLSKLSIDALVWSDTFWPVTNPYLTTDSPEFTPLGSPDTYRAPDDFCYVTSMRKQDLNFAFIIIPIALLNLAVLTVWFPIALKRLVDKNLPRVDKFNEMGEARKDIDKDYKELLDKDTCPYNFLYNGYHQRWATYKTFIMVNKIFLILLVVLISKDNCLFRSFGRTRIETIRQALQITLMFTLLLIHWRTQPFLLESQNISEYWSRFGYMITSFLGLFVVLQVGSTNAIFIVITVINYTMGVAVVWCVIKETDRFQSFVKNMQQRLDFSINIYSPKLDFNKHIKRRIWQETWTTLLLTCDQFKMPEKKIVAFSQSSYRPPYLLNFSGSVAERHIENLKVIQHIGIKQYNASIAPLSEALAIMRLKIYNNFVGPDMYYAPEMLMVNLKTYFGKAYVVPFPFSVVFVYDEDDSVVTLTKEWEIERYIRQNEDREIERRRGVRQMLRALEGKIVVGPCSDIGGGHNAVGLLSIQRKQGSRWRGINMNSGFEVTITYTDHGEINGPDDREISPEPPPPHERAVGHDILGITSDFALTPQLQRLISDNSQLIESGFPKIRELMKEYRKFYHNEAVHKKETLTYAFFINIYDNPSIPLESLPTLLMSTEENPLIHSIPEAEYPALVYLYERMRVVNLSRVHQWWFLFWDDLWRKNAHEIPYLSQHPQDFSPTYRKSICYRPMIRAKLEEFLERRGCWKNGGKAGFLHSGVLNRVYLYLNNVIFYSGVRGKGRKKRRGGGNDEHCEKGSHSDNTWDSNIVLGRVQWTWRERLVQGQDILLGRRPNPQTRPFFKQMQSWNNNISL
ncbi:7731_t:CDS:2 [Ambispora gerdemannii]|uniref:7731_t:CDS:1 n=1 Tax=Ambispora gerdemannii TaxID=144530 RepID=A0A9N9FEC8_9GLOM|nr:7731_t:CDS:2 [Ambispora gerdemannii]